jgi:hypothetical protein
MFEKSPFVPCMLLQGDSHLHIFFLKVWLHAAALFVYFLLLYIHSPIAFAELQSNLLIAI